MKKLLILPAFLLHAIACEQESIDVLSLEGDEWPTIEDEQWGCELRLAAYYPFNGNANDESGNEHHGDVQGALLTEDRFGNPEGAYFFDGVDDVIALESGIYEGYFISISAWFKKTGDGPDPWNSIVAGDCSVPYFGLQFNSPTFGGQCCMPMDHQFGELTIQDNEWHHMVGIYEGNRILLFVDNHIVVDQYVGQFRFDNSIPIGIGGSYQHFRDHEGFNGIIDEVRIYEGALNEEDVEALFKEEDLPKQIYN